MKPNNLSTYHKLTFLDGLELLNAKNHTLDFPFHTHNTFNIALVLNQPFQVKLLDKVIYAPVGSLSITNPDEVHSTPCEKQIGNSFFTFYISPDVLKDLNNGDAVFFEEKTIYDDLLFKMLFRLAQNCINPNSNFENDLLFSLQKLVKNHSKKSVYKSNETSLFKLFIEETNFEKFSLTMTANKFGMDKFKFLRLFRQETGLTPNNYIIQKRIEKCKKMLLTDNDLLEIAIETGFYDATHLCKHFKRFTGVTPFQYKNA